MKDQEIVDSKYMIRKRPSIPKGEITRGYRRIEDKKSYNFLYECDYDDTDRDDS